MTGCHTTSHLRDRLLAGDDLTDTDTAHLAGCAACSAEARRINSLGSALDASAAALVTQQLPAETLSVARRMDAQRAMGHFGRLAVSIGTAMAVGLLAAVVGVQAARVADGRGLGFEIGSLGSAPIDHGPPPPPGAWEAFEACMADGGYPLDTYPVPGEGRIPADSVWATDDWLRVNLRCIASSGIGEVDGDEPNEIAAENAQAWAWTSCMRQEGWNLPDPEPEPLGRYLYAYHGAEPPGGGDQDAYNASVRSCANQLAIPIEGEPGS